MAQSGDFKRRSNLDGIDGPALVHSGSAGFTVLIIGGALASPGSKIPGVGMYWVILTSVIAFIIAGAKIGNTDRPCLQGSIASVASYLLAIPVVAMTNSVVDMRQVIATTVTAVGVGAASGAVSRFGRCRWRTRHAVPLGQPNRGEVRGEL